MNLLERVMQQPIWAERVIWEIARGFSIRKSNRFLREKLQKLQDRESS